jgi:acyl-coenzyme A synthetase/AMP-(fatty) acid ligase
MSHAVKSANVAQFVARMAGRGDARAVDSGAGALTYRELLAASERWIARLQEDGVGRGTVCAYLGDYSGKTIALFVALMRLAAIAVPATSAIERELPQLAVIAGAERLIRLGPDGTATIEHLDFDANPLIESFRPLGHPGLVVFTSGSTGQPKGILHDLDRVLGKFTAERRGWRTVLFLMMDHFGGVNTLLSALANGGVGVCVEERSPEAVCRAITRSRADLLPTTPTFLNMIIASGAWRNHDLASLRMITYGAEPMPQSTLERVREIAPQAELKQTYGLSELGVLRSQSPDPGSLWLRIGGAGFETRVVDGMLHVRSSSSMVGYLNAPSPIDADGWMNTGDLVEERDGLIRFLGRVSEIINVGGQKVFPTEVETVLLDAPNVTDATVFGVRHPLLGQAVCARVSLAESEAESALSDRLRQHCLARLAKFKVPLRFEIAQLSAQATERAKKRRTAAHDEAPAKSRSI